MAVGDQVPVFADSPGKDSHQTRVNKAVSAVVKAEKAVGDVSDPTRLDLALAALADAKEAVQRAKLELKHAQEARLKEMWR